MTISYVGFVAGSLQDIIYSRGWYSTVLVAAARVSYLADKPSADAEEVIREMCACVHLCACVCPCARTDACVMQFVNYSQAYVSVILAHGINIQEYCISTKQKCRTFVV